MSAGSPDPSRPAALDALLGALPRWVLVGGKGGVGKTTTAAAIAARSAARGTRTLLLSTDPARTLGEAIGHPLGATPAPVPGAPRLFAAQLDAEHARAAFLARWRDTLVTIVDRGTYLDEEDITGLVDATLPGVDEAMALLTLAALETEEWPRIVVDTAPTGHTLRLLALPATFRALVGLLERMQAKHRFMVSALTHRYRADAADAFLDEMRRQLAALDAVLRDPARSAMVLVARAEEVVAEETARYADRLRALGIAVGAVVVNASPQSLSAEGRRAMETLASTAPDVPRFHVPLLSPPPSGMECIRRFGEALEAGAAPIPAQAEPARRDRMPEETRTAESPIPILPFTIVGGKGGVGKTTAACALALAAAGRGSPVLLVSTDPAPSVADALGQPIGDEEAPVLGAAGLVARQIDASAAFARLREAWQERIDALFAAVMGRGVDAAHDRDILRDLLDLAPPGIDELYALASIGETLAEQLFATVVVDPAPTGHLLRLLEMPAVALDWSHRLMRIMLKYREVAGLGDAASELLAFAKRTRAVRELLADPARAGLLVVALDEPLVRGETARLVSRVRTLGVRVSGVLWNRVGAPPRPLEGTGAPPQFAAPALDPPPRGVEALRRWYATWEPLHEHG